MSIVPMKSRARNGRYCLKRLLSLTVALFLLVSVSAFAQDQKPGLDTVIPGGIQVNNEDIHDVLSILSQFSGLNMTADRDVIGRVSFQFAHDVTIRTILDSILPAYDWCYDFNEEAQLVNIRRAGRCGGGPGPMVETAVIRLDYISLEKATGALKKVLSGEHGVMAANPENNTVVVTDTAPNVQRARALMKDLDVDALATVVLPIEFADPAEVKQALAPHLSPDAYLHLDSRTSRLIIRDHRSKAEAARHIVDAMDTPPRTKPADAVDEPVIVFLDYLGAHEAAKVVVEMPHWQKGLDMKTLPRLNAVSLEGDPAEIKTARDLLLKMDVDQRTAFRQEVSPEVLASATHTVKPLLSKDALFVCTHNPPAINIHDLRSRLALVRQVLPARDSISATIVKDPSRRRDTGMGGLMSELEKSIEEGVMDMVRGEEKTFEDLASEIRQLKMRGIEDDEGASDASRDAFAAGWMIKTVLGNAAIFVRQDGKQRTLKVGDIVDEDFVRVPPEAYEMGERGIKLMDVHPESTSATLRRHDGRTLDLRPPVKPEAKAGGTDRSEREGE